MKTARRTGSRGRSGGGIFFQPEPDNTPAILKAQHPQALQRVLRQLAETDIPLQPTHMLGHDLRDGVAYEHNGWHMYSQGGDARIVPTKYGPLQNRRKAMQVTFFSQYAWQGRGLGEWSFNALDQYGFALLILMSVSRGGLGGFFIGCLKGPNKNNPAGGEGTTFGSDRGWAISANDGGGIGVSVYGDENIADQDARVFRPNIDFTSDGSASVTDGRVRAYVLGWDPDFGGTGKGAGYIYGPGLNHRVSQYFDPGGGVGTCGNSLSPDGRMSFGDINYGGDNVNYATAELLLMASFSGREAASIHALRSTLPAAIQETL